MTWFAAHIILSVRLKAGTQPNFPVWENIVLVEAGAEESAFTLAEQFGRREEGDEEGAFRWEGHPAEWIFVGVRKLTECAIVGDRLESGTEVGFNELEVESPEEVERLAAGEPVTVRYCDRYRPPAPRKQPTRKPKRPPPSRRTGS